MTKKENAEANGVFSISKRLNIKSEHAIIKLSYIDKIRNADNYCAERMVLMKAKLQKKYDLYIGGEWVAAGDKELIAVHSPIDGKELAHIAEATEADVEKAV
ncbi:hypothetical protein HMPREF3224_02644, partial [Anaerococcus hydrogenalis]